MCDDAVGDARVEAPDHLEARGIRPVGVRELSTDEHGRGACREVDDGPFALERRADGDGHAGRALRAVALGPREVRERDRQPRAPREGAPARLGLREEPPLLERADEHAGLGAERQLVLERVAERDHRRLRDLLHDQSAVAPERGEHGVAEQRRPGLDAVDRAAERRTGRALGDDRPYRVHVGRVVAAVSAVETPRPGEVVPLLPRPERRAADPRGAGELGDREIIRHNVEIIVDTL